ncbi:MAG: rubredoxin [Desulfobacterales bacterium]|nr:MAG: rubredoxin [Desulfobacterales bacterium]
MKKWQCSVCKYIHEGDEPPEKCPICGVPAEKFVLLEDTEAPKDKSATAKETSSSPPEAPKKDKPKAKTPSTATPDTLYKKMTALMMKHHAHPVTVHTPNGILPAATVLFVIGWLFDSVLMGKAGFINLIFVILVLPIVLFSGVVAWKLKYRGAMSHIFKVKILAALVTTTACAISTLWYLADPTVLESPYAWAFIVLNLVMLGAAGVAGHLGGKLVFKD